MRLGALLALALLFPAIAAGSTAKWKNGAPLPLARGEVTAASRGQRDLRRRRLHGRRRRTRRASTPTRPRTNTWGQDRRPARLGRPRDERRISREALRRGRVRGRPLAADDALLVLERLVDSAAADARGTGRGGAAIVEREAVRRRRGHGGTFGVGARSRGRRSSTTSRAGRWSSIPGPTPREHLGVTALGGRIYAVGGRLAGADTNLALLESFDPGAKKWRRLKPVPARRGGTAAAGLGRWLVSAGGETPTVTIRTVYRYDVRNAPLVAAPEPADAAARARRRRVRPQGVRDRRRDDARARGQLGERVSGDSIGRLGHDVAPAARVVDDVDAVVLPVRARDPEEEREPAPEAEPPLAGEAAARRRASAPRPESRARPAAGRRSGRPRTARRPPVGAPRPERSDMRHETQCRFPERHLLRMPAPVRRKLIFACLSLAALALVLTGTALAGARRSRAAGRLAERRRDPGPLLVVLAVTGRDLRHRRGRADPVHRPLPQPRPRARPRKARRSAATRGSS